MLSGEAKKIQQFIVFGLTRSGVESTIYRTRGEHSNHYTTDAVRETRSDKMMQTAGFRLLTSRCHTGKQSLPRTDMCDERRTIKKRVYGLDSGKLIVNFH